MVRLTLIARLIDGLPLAEGLDTDKDLEIDHFKSQAKSVFKKLSQSGSFKQETKMSVESGNFIFHYVISSGVCFLTLTEKGYPKKLAFQYLDELNGEFGRLYGTQVDQVTRPYAFIKFDTFIQKTKRLYMDTRSNRNLANLNNDLTEVHSIMTRTMAEMLGQGEKLDGMTRMSNTLSAESRQYLSKTKDMHRQALIRKYMPIAVVVGIVVLVLLFRWFFY